MYLDSNGDGIHTAADVLNGVGATQVTIWLDTNHGRDGTEATCTTESTPINLQSSYSAVIRAVGGTFSCSNPVTLQPLFSTPYLIKGGPTEFHIGYFGLGTLGTGKFALMRFTTSVSEGTPSLELVPRATTLGTFPLITEFGSHCPALDFDNTMKLGSDWMDVDGLTYSPGGSTNGAPIIPPIAAISASTGERVSRDVTITDPDGDQMTVAISGQTLLSLAPLFHELGSSRVRIHVQPRRGDAGAYDATLVARDGFNESETNVRADVVPGSNHPPVLDRADPIVVVATTVQERWLRASDSDGDVVTFTKAAGPAYAELAAGGSGSGASAARLTLRPTLCDIGDATVRVTMGDGFGEAAFDVPIHVLPLEAPPETPDRRTSVGEGAIADSAPGDFNEDTHQDLVAVGEVDGRLYMILGDGTGGLAPAAAMDLGQHLVAVAAGDWNGDGHLDVAAGSSGDEPLRVLYGRGNGTFEGPVTFASIGACNRLLSLDLNDDGINDLVAAGRVDNSTSLLGSPTGLSIASRLQGLFAVAGIASGDFDRDGQMDLAVSGAFPRSITILAGRGDGTFAGRRVLPLSEVENGLVSGDWNRDGKLDLASIDDVVGTVRGFLGDGAGGFTEVALAQFDPGSYYDLQALDWNSDGSSDLVVSGSILPSGTVLLGHPDGSFTSAPLPARIEEARRIRFADYNEDGRPDILAPAGSQVRLILNTTPGPNGVPARAFTGDRKTIAVTSSSNTFQARLEPVDAAFTADEVNPASLLLTSEGTGSVSSISAVTPKSTTLGDLDRNGVTEYPVSFAMADVARLFDGLHGKQSVNPHVEGSLRNGRRFCAPLAMKIVVTGGGGSLAARVEPNPLNPRGVLRFSVGKEGAVTVRLFDTNGRMVRTVWDHRVVAPGIQETPIDGRNAAGQSLATGVYFFRIEAEGRTTSGRFTVLK